MPQSGFIRLLPNSVGGFHWPMLVALVHGAATAAAEVLPPNPDGAACNRKRVGLRNGMQSAFS
ncbi:MAG: hypothetical protein DMF24_06785 [Verrucomicrobia bacterium]|nr:MAG: hypothetical protein DME90_02980 [Verrucomicrobiota bacterium]PYL61557.1 MAG: hypothetical protein DMF24_06785 [Verrucomicrobiota bacterium]